MSETPNNPWRTFVENVISGDNYFRSSEYNELLDYIDGLIVSLDAVTRERDLFYAALDCLARLGNEPCLGNSRGNQIAQDALGGRYIAEVEQEQKRRNADIERLTRERDEAQIDAKNEAIEASRLRKDNQELNLQTLTLAAQVNGFYAGTPDSRLLAITKERDALRAEVERLRSVLERIAAYPSQRNEEMTIVSARDMARAALTPAEVTK
jgi:hypothetical protein